MKGVIIIDGQVGSVFSIARYLHNYTSKTDRFSAIRFEYSRKGQARLDLQYAYKRLKEECLDDPGTIKPILKRTRGGSGDTLQYDSAIAKVI